MCGDGHSSHSIGISIGVEERTGARTGASVPTLGPPQGCHSVVMRPLCASLWQVAGGEPHLLDRLNHAKFIAAPMVGASDLPYRLLVRKHGTDLCYTQMIHSANFLTNPDMFRREHFDPLDAGTLHRAVEIADSGKPQLEALLRGVCVDRLLTSVFQRVVLMCSCAYVRRE